MHNARSSFITRALRIAMLASLAVVPLAGGDVAAHQSAEPPLDLPAMALRPADLAGEGLEGFGMSFSVLALDAGEAGDFVASGDIDPESDDVDAYVEADAERYYILDLDNSVLNDADGFAYYSQVVETFVLEYDDEDDAVDGLGAMHGVWSESDRLAEEDVTGNIGDSAFYLEGEGIDNVSLEPTERTLLVFQQDNLVAGILTYNSDADGTFDQDVTEALGHSLLDRVDAGLDGDTPGLSTKVVRMDVPADNALFDSYMTIDGEILCSSNTVAADECDDFQAFVDDYNEVDRYFLNWRIAGDWEVGAPESFIQNSVRIFADDASAEARFAELRDNQPHTLADVEDLDLGDESVRWSTMSNGLMIETVLVRSGGSVFEMRQSTEHALAAELGWTFEPSPDALHELAGIQLACLDGEASCAEPIAIPDGMLPAELQDAATQTPGRIATLPNGRFD